MNRLVDHCVYHRIALELKRKYDQVHLSVDVDDWSLLVMNEVVELTKVVVERNEWKVVID